MITDQDVVFTSHGPVTVRVHHNARFYRGVTALLEGAATHECPLHFVILGCHADMADEAPIATTERLVRALTDEVLMRLRNQQTAVRDILQASNVAAAATDRYYSIAAGRMTQRSVTVGAIGDVDAIVVKGNASTPIITANVVRVGEHAILDAAFGIGFREEAVQVKQVDLENEGMLLLILGGDAVTVGVPAGHQGVEAIIEDVARAGRISPPVVAVIR